jgi:hypothetical protein
MTSGVRGSLFNNLMIECPVFVIIHSEEVEPFDIAQGHGIIE